MNENEVGEEVIEAVDPVEQDQTATDTESVADIVEESADDEVVVTIGDEPAADEEHKEAAPEWVREVRKTNRELQRKNRELEDRLKAASVPQQDQAPKIGVKPTLEGCEYDAEKYETLLEQWHADKRKHEEHAAKAKQAQEQQEAEWKAKLATYATARGALKVKDYAEAEDTVVNALSVTQQNIIIDGAENPALLVYALGKNEKKLKELAEVKSLAKFTFMLAKLEKDLKVTTRKDVTAPMPKVQGTARISGASDSQLESLRAQAEKTGDYSKVIAYKNAKRNK